MKKTVFTIVSLILVMAMVLTGCGSKDSGKVPALKKGEALELKEWTMNATAWSSPNGATVNVTAVPNGYAEGQSVAFCVRLEGEDVANVECLWDGSVYTASADLNGNDGYCYFMILTAADGAKSEVAINTPTSPSDNSLINLATALNAYCEASVGSSKLDGGKLIVEEGSIKIQLPFLTLDTGAVACQKTALVLGYNGADFASQEMKNPTGDESGVCVMDISGMSFDIPAEIEDDHQLTLRLDVTLSNGHTLSAPAGTWYYLDGQLLLAVG